MDENKTLIENETNKIENEADKYEVLEEALNKQFRKIANQNMALGFQVSCHTVLEKIYAFERSPGSKSTNDYKRLVKYIKKFCETGVSRKVNPDGTIGVEEEQHEINGGD